MTQLRFLPASFAASAIFLFSSFAGAVAAPPAGCGTGPTCGQGFECTVVGTSGCAPAACPPGQTCPEPVPCTETQEMGCTLAHCSVDSDCASGMLCHVWQEPCAVSDCACAPDQPNCDCAQPACDPITVSMCTPRYLLPCAAAADCGSGFTCEDAPANCACAGSAPSPGPTPPTPGASPEAAGGAPDTQDAVPNTDPGCTCEPSGQKQCVVKAMNCQSSAECPAGWTCEQEAAASSPACSGKDCGATPPPVSTSSCRPPYYGGKGVDPQVPGGTPISTGNPNGGGTGTGTGTGTSGGTTKPETKATDDGAHESAACSLGHAPASNGALAMLAMLGALFGLKRRRN